MEENKDKILESKRDINTVDKSIEEKKKKLSALLDAWEIKPSTYEYLWNKIGPVQGS